MHNAVDPGGDVLDLPVVRKISGNELLIRVNIGGFRMSLIRMRG